MPYATDAEFVLRVPAVSAVGLGQRALALEDAAALIDPEQWGLRTARAQCLLAAHFLAVAVPPLIAGADGGLVDSRSAGEISVGYAVPTIPEGWDPVYMTTAYGRQFLTIANTIVSFPEAV